MGTTTAIHNLYRPARGETGWYDLVNANFDTLDLTMVSGGEVAGCNRLFGSLDAFSIGLVTSGINRLGITAAGAVTVPISLNIGGSIAVTGVIDDDTMGTASAVSLATSESIAVYANTVGAAALAAASIYADGVGAATLVTANSYSDAVGAAAIGSANGYTDSTLAAFVGTTNIVTLGTIATGTWQGTTIAVDQGGTGQTTYTDGQLLIGNTTGNTLAKATLTGTANRVTVTNGNGTITLSGPQDLGTTSTPIFGNLTIGTGVADVDYTLTFDGDDADCEFKWDEGLAVLQIDQSVDVSGDLTGVTLYGDGSNLTGVGAAAASAVTATAKVNEGAGISKGQCVYVSGATGQTQQVSLCDNTDSTKYEFLGLAAETKADGQTILIRVGGALTGVDTDGTGVPGTAESWSDGDPLYMITAGNLSNVRPTSGTVQHVCTVEYAHGTVGKLQVHSHPEPYVAVPSGIDLDLRMGDDVGSNKVSFENYSDAEVASVDSLGRAIFAQLTIAQAVATSGSPTAGTFTGGAHTTLAASTEATDILFDLGRTVQFATGALATQRAIQILAPTYGFVGASTLADSATVYIDNAPQAGANATLTRPYAVWIDAGDVRLDDNLGIGLGTMALEGELHMARGNANCQLFMDCFDDSTATNEINLRKSHNDSIGTLTDTVTTEIFGIINFTGIDNTQARDSGAQIYAIQNGAAGVTLPTDLIIKTWDDSSGTSTFKFGTDGVLTVPSGLVVVGPGRITEASESDQTGTPYTIVIGDAGKVVFMSNAGANVCNIPLNASVAFTTNTVIDVVMEGAGATTVTAVNGVTLNGVNNGSCTIGAQYSAVTIVKRGADAWIVYGDHGGVA